ncbi:MAG: glycosyltransferase [Sedimenticola sp.]|nr:glycosyltransferase [Sedimenticola sp.]
MVNRVFMIAYHYPPVRVSSGLQRTLVFSRELSKYGWQPQVLTVHPRAYIAISNDQLTDIPNDVLVKRAFALDASRHLSFKGKYPSLLALPDRWSSWWFGGVWSGLQLIRKNSTKVIWSTYPIATAHLIGLTLQRLTGLPWVADFRDSMTDTEYPQPGLRRKIYLWIEKKTVETCTSAVFTTPSTLEMYRNRYPDVSGDKWLLMPNGYNEEIFEEIESDERFCRKQLELKEKQCRPLVFVHSGVIYPDERDPMPFFEALALLKKQNLIAASDLKIILRATGHDDVFRPLLANLNISDIVQLEAGIAYRDALKEMLLADGLIIFQAANCNHQVPAKIYEYFRAQKPIIAFTDTNGDTASLLSNLGFSDIAPLDNVELIQDVLIGFIKKIKVGSAVIAKPEAVIKHSRQTTVIDLAACFNSANI